MKFLKSFLLATLCFTLPLVITNIAFAKVYNWQIAESWSKHNSELNTASRLMIRYAKELSNGQLNITAVGNEDLPTSSDIFDLVKNNSYQMGHASSSFWQDKDKNMLFFSSLPFGMINPEMQAWFYEGDGLQLMEKVYSKHGLLSFPGGSFDTQMGGWFKQPINSVNDLKGLRMRVTGVAADILKDLGVNVINSSSEQLFIDFKSGKIDAATWNGPSLDTNMRFAEIANYYYTAWHEPSAELQFLINQSAYDSLPDSLKYVLTTAMRLAAYDTYTQVKHNNALKLKELKKKFPLTKIQAFPTNVMTAFKNSTNKKMQSLASRGGLTAEILSSLTNYQKQVRLWTRIGDQAYLNN